MPVTNLTFNFSFNFLTFRFNSRQEKKGVLLFRFKKKSASFSSDSRKKVRHSLQIQDKKAEPPAIWKCFSKHVLLKISQVSEENIYVGEFFY